MNPPKREPGPDQANYRIRVCGQLDDTWSQWFDGLTLSCQRANDGTRITVLTGAVADQPKLRGLLARMWDLNLTVLSVERITPGPDQPPPDVHPQAGGEPWENS
jgi:hypothetical protein